MLTYAAWLLIIAAGAALFAAVRSRTSDARALWLALALPSAAMITFMWRVSEPAERFADFRHAYYFAGRQIRNDPSALYDTFDPTAGFTNIPIVAWLFAPFTVVGEGAAGWIMLAIGVAAIVAACALTIRMTRATGPQPYAIVALFVVSGPLYNSVREGNTTHLILLVLVTALWCAERRRDVALGVLLAVAAIIKPPLVLLLVPFLVRRRWGAAEGFAATAVPVVAFSLAIYGIDLHRDWYDATVAPFSRHPLGAFNVQSLDAFLARLSTGSDHLMDWEPITSFGSTFRIARNAAMLALLAAATAVCWRWQAVSAPRNDALDQRARAVADHSIDGETDAIDIRIEFCVALVLSLIVTPISWSHYYLLLLLPMSLLITGRIPFPDRWTWWLALAVCIALLSPPVIAVNTQQAVIGGIIARVVVSHYVIGATALLALLLAARYRAATAAPAEAPVPGRSPARRRAFGSGGR